MPKKFNEGASVRLKVATKFSNPEQILPKGSEGTVLDDLEDGTYRVKFDDRNKESIIDGKDLE